MVGPARLRIKSKVMLVLLVSLGSAAVIGLLTWQRARTILTQRIFDQLTVETIHNEFSTRIFYAAKRNGLTIPFPIRTLHHVPQRRSKRADYIQEVSEFLRSLSYLAFLDADDIAHLAKSDFFGETALLVGEASLVTGIVEQDLSVLVFDHDEIATLMASSARFANQMNQFIEDRKTSIRLAQEIKSIQPLANYPIAIR